MIFWYLLYLIPRVVRILQILVILTQIPFLGAAPWSPRDHLSWGSRSPPRDPGYSAEMQLSFAPEWPFP